ncbi:hypothetical protein PENTCL1PPCAC_14062, partial [Pristionchus entomophagus]
MVWLCTTVIPLLFYFLECQYVYEPSLRLYYHKCYNANYDLEILLNCLIYLSYACAVVVLVIYCLLYVFLRKQRKELSRAERSAGATSTQMKLLRQSVVVFAFYAVSKIKNNNNRATIFPSQASIAAVIAVPHVHPTILQGFDLAYVENLLNLSIAAVYPICFLAMSGEMRK